MWYLSMEDQDWMAQINDEDDHFYMQYRHRYYKDDKNFDSEDVKKWYEGKISKEHHSKEEAIALIDDLAAKGEEYFGGELTRIFRCADETMEQFMDRFSELPFVHKKVLSKEEAEAEGYDTYA